MSKKVGVFHPGTQHSWQTSRALQDKGLLRWYATSIFYRHERLPAKMIGKLPRPLKDRVEKEFKRFYHPKLSPQFVRTSGLHEILERVLSRLGCAQAAATINKWGNRAFGRWVQHLIAQEPVDVAWGYDAASIEVFRYAKNIGVFTVLDKTIGDPRVYNSIMSEVYKQYTKFFMSDNFRIPQWSIEIQDMEYDLADAILVGSPFCKGTIISPLARPDVEAKIRVIPYCFDDVFFSAQATPRSLVSGKRPLRFLFLGQASPRKGIHLLLNAFARLPRSAATLTIVGQMQIPKAVFNRFADRITWHPTAPRSGVAQFLQDSDCLILPSYFEGSAITIYEALACGRGVIQSKNTDTAACPHAGLILDRLDEDALYDAMMFVIDRPYILGEWGASATKIAERFTFECYRDAISNFLQATDGVPQ